MWLNFYGWSALVATGLVVGVALALLTPLFLWVALLAGILATWALVLLLDHRRYRNAISNLVDDRLDSETGAAVVAQLAELGVAAKYEGVRR